MNWYSAGGRSVDSRHPFLEGILAVGELLGGRVDHLGLLSQFDRLCDAFLVQVQDVGEYSRTAVLVIWRDVAAHVTEGTLFVCILEFLHECDVHRVFHIFPRHSRNLHVFEPCRRLSRLVQKPSVQLPESLVGGGHESSIVAVGCADAHSLEPFDNRHVLTKSWDVWPRFDEFDEPQWQ